MADNVIDTPAAPQADAVVDQQATFKADLDRNMQIAFTGRIPPETAQSNADIPVDTAVANTVIEPVNTPVVGSDSFSLFKEKFGYETPEAAFKEIEELRSLRENPSVSFENEDSAALFRAFQAGKNEEVYSYLHSQRQIDSLINKDVDKNSAAEIVKLGMQLKYKELTPEEINYQFNKQFALPAKPIQDADEDETDYQNRLAGWESQVQDKTFELTIAAKQYKPELAAAKKQLVVPKIVDSVDEGYLQYKQMLEDNSKTDQETREAYKAFTPQHLETKIKFKDEANKIDFDFQYIPSGEDFGKAVGIVSDFNELVKTFQKPDGTPDRLGFLKAMQFGRNYEKIITEAMNQAKNATIKAMLPDNNSDQRLQPTLEQPSELDQQMKRALKGYGGF